MKLRVKTAQSFSELCAAFSLVHEQYSNAGLIAPNRSRMYYKPRDLDPSTVVSIVKDNEEIVGTATVYQDTACNLPLASLFYDELKANNLLSCKCVEGTKFASKVQSCTSKTAIPSMLISWIFNWCVANNIEHVLMITHPDHASFWNRASNFVQISSVKDCPHVKNAPGVLLDLDVQRTVESRGEGISRKARKLLLESNINEKIEQASYQINEDELGMLTTISQDAFYMAKDWHTS